MTHPLRSTDVTPLHRFYEMVRHLTPNPYVRSRGSGHLQLFRSQRRQASHVPYGRLFQAQPTCTPDAVPPVNRLRRNLSRDLLTTAVLTPSQLFSTRETVVPFRPSSWKSPDPNFASGPFPSPLTPTSVRTQQRKVIGVLPLEVGSRGLPSSTVELRKPLRSFDRYVLLVAQLECKFNSQLHEARWRGLLHLAERRTIKIAVHRRWPEELRVIEHIESFKPELHCLCFGQRNGF